MHENAENTLKVFDFINYYQKRIKNSSKIKKILLETKKYPNFNEFGGHFRRSLMSKLQNFLPLRPNHGGPSRVTTFIKNLQKLPPHFSKLDYGPAKVFVYIILWPKTSFLSIYRYYNTVI